MPVTRQNRKPSTAKTTSHSTDITPRAHSSKDKQLAQKRDRQDRKPERSSGPTGSIPSTHLSTSTGGTVHFTLVRDNTSPDPKNPKKRGRQKRKGNTVPKKQDK